MDSSSRILAVVSSIIVMALVGCAGGNTSTLVPGSNALVLATPAVSLKGESFYATQVHVHDTTSFSCSDTAGLIDIEISFSAKGTAKGPQPGTFTAKGDWYYFPEWVSGPPPSFAESFTIQSKVGTIRGDAGANPASPKGMTCRHFESTRPEAVKWRLSGGGKGWMKVPMIRRGLLEEAFY
jgi:hypothetical protein